MARRPGMYVVKDNTSQLIRGLDVLTNTRVMVGIPQADDDREDEHDEIGNAEIGWLMENGIPERNVPARPHMVPGVRRAQAKVVDYLKQAGRLAVEGKPDSVFRALHAAGLTASMSIKNIIREGIPPALADSTIRARTKNRKGARLELANRAAGMAPSTELVKPLINTGQYLAAITHVLRTVSGKRRGNLKK